MVKFHRQRGGSLLNEIAKPRSVYDESRRSCFKISFRDFDASQKYASSFLDWQNCGWLSKAVETLQGYCNPPLLQQADGDKFAIYGSFPPSDKTMFDYPRGVPEDANWARIHILNKAVIIGHIVGDTFYVVFLDKTHKFWLTKQARGEK